MSNEKQLPPELVQKMRHTEITIEGVAHGLWEDDFNKSPLECAQIAVDYRESEIAVLETDKAMLESELHSVKQQRDELMEALNNRIKELREADSKFCNDRWNNKLPQGQRLMAREMSNEVTFARKELESILKLIKKHDEQQNI